MTDYNAASQKAAMHLDRANSQYEAIRSNDHLTPEGKAEQIQSVYENTKAVVDRLKDELTTGQDVSARMLTRSLFGGSHLDGAGAVAATAASDRAASIDDATTALRVLKDAMLDGNDFLAKAIARKAIDAWLADDVFGAPWRDVVNTWCEASPARERDVQKLVDLRTRKGEGMLSTLAFVTPAPPEARSSVFSSW